MSKEEKVIDLFIIGAGITGLTAGIYTSKLKLSTLILEDELVGGQIREAYNIENYPGFSSITGNELVTRTREQYESSGGELDEFNSIKSVILTNTEKIIETETFIYRPHAVIIASGSKRKSLPIPEEKQFYGKGIHYCELCDGSLYEGKHLLVVGGGNSALNAAVFLTRYAAKITIIHRSSSFRADKKTIDEVLTNNKISVIFNSEIRNAIGSNFLEKVIYVNNLTNESSELIVDGIFVYIGLSPRTEMYKEFLDIDNHGHIIAGESCETNIKGVYAAGDVRTKRFRQLTTAVSDGTVAALMAEDYIKFLKQL